MDRNEAKEFYPILHAFAEGKVIECRLKPDFIKGSGFSNDWTGVKDLWYMKGLEYRIKPEQEPKYRPFANAEECWKEMLKHQPFGWVKEKERNVRTVINYVHNDGVILGCGPAPFKHMFGIYTFVDGTPFGIKVEE